MLHGLKHKQLAASQIAFAERRSAGSFQPLPRTCSTCKAMGVSSWPGSVINHWTCCFPVGHIEAIGMQAPGGHRKRSKSKPSAARNGSATEWNDPTGVDVQLDVRRWRLFAVNTTA